MDTRTGSTTSSSLPLINIGGQNWQTGSAIGYQNGFNFGAATIFALIPGISPTT